MRRRAALFNNLQNVIYRRPQNQKGTYPVGTIVQFPRRDRAEFPFNQTELQMIGRHLREREPELTKGIDDPTMSALIDRYMNFLWATVSRVTALAVGLALHHHTVVWLFMNLSRHA